MANAEENLKMLESGMVGSRRAFLQEGSAAIFSTAVGLGRFSSSAAASAKPAQSETPFNVDSSRSKKCILLFLHGGASQLETFDPKPHAPAHIRGHFNAVATSVPGVHFSEILPKLAMLADRFAVVRSLTWDGPATHVAGIELMQTGAVGGLSPQPTLAADVCTRSATQWRDGGLPAAVVVGGRLQDVTGREILESAEQILGAEWRPPLAVSAHRSSQHRADSKAEFIFQPQVCSGKNLCKSVDYGSSTFGENCHLAMQLVNAGVRFVTVNMFPQPQGNLSWDCHADGGDLPTSLQDYRDTVCPQFDAGCAALLQ